jgi:hypothetical protein
MASNANWTIIFDDKMIINQSVKNDEGHSIGYTINDDAFWNDSKWSNIWAIQHGATVSTDEVEYRDETPHSAYDASVLGDISQFTTRWDAAHLENFQTIWDFDNVEGETEAEKIARLGARPTSS